MEREAAGDTDVPMTPIVHLPPEGQPTMLSQTRPSALSQLQVRSRSRSCSLPQTFFLISDHVLTSVRYYSISPV